MIDCPVGREHIFVPMTFMLSPPTHVQVIRISELLRLLGTYSTSRLDCSPLPLARAFLRRVMTQPIFSCPSQKVRNNRIRNATDRPKMLSPVDGLYLLHVGHVDLKMGCLFCEIF